MLSQFKRLRLELDDLLRYHPAVRGALSRWRFWRVGAPDLNDSQAVARAIVRLCAAARVAEDRALERRIIERIVELVSRLDGSRIDWREFALEFNDPRLCFAAVLKPRVGPREKGVLFVSYETQWIKLLKPANWRELAERYTVVLAPSSSPPHAIFNYAFPALFPGPVFTLLSNPRDAELFGRMSANLVVVPLYASSWVNPDLYVPRPKKERAWDLLMVANFAKVKRHHALFAALGSMPRSMRVLLIGQDQDGRTAETIRALASWYGVADRFTLLGHQPYAEVAKAYCNARASVVLSKREGSCVAVAESLFADAPVALLQEASIGSRVFINDQTGRFLDGRNLARDLTEFVETADRYEPRAWAERHISCWQSSRILNDLLKTHALAAGQEWTCDIAPLQWSPEPMLARPEDRARLERERVDILERFGLEIGRPTTA